jgi:thioredoxin 1
MSNVFRSILLLAFLVTGTAFAASPAFTQAAFDKLQAQGKPVLVEVHADWCAYCKAQEPSIDDLLKTPELKSISALRVDFDTQKDILREFNVSMQSTLIVFKGGNEVGRSTGVTDRDSIAALLKKVN